MPGLFVEEKVLMRVDNCQETEMNLFCLSKDSPLVCQFTFLHLRRHVGLWLFITFPQIYILQTSMDAATTEQMADFQFNPGAVNNSNINVHMIEMFSPLGVKYSHGG